MAQHLIVPMLFMALLSSTQQAQSAEFSDGFVIYSPRVEISQVLQRQGPSCLGCEDLRFKTIVTVTMHGEQCTDQLFASESIVQYNERGQAVIIFSALAYGHRDGVPELCVAENTKDFKISLDGQIPRHDIELLNLKIVH